MFNRIELVDDIIHNVSFENILECCGNTDVCYIDPPYFVQGGALYQHGMSETQHIDLCNILKSANYKWILSYDNCDFIVDIYKDFNIVQVDINYSITNSGKSNELIITNFEHDTIKFN